LKDIRFSVIDACVVGRHRQRCSAIRPQGDNAMAVHLGRIAPDFEQDSTVGRPGFHEWLGCLRVVEQPNLPHEAV
jgi:hypothetical protein